jgi:hypothetical protein
MPIDPLVKRSWIEAQKGCAVPVNAIGVKIDPRDQATLEIWKREGIDRFLKQNGTA